MNNFRITTKLRMFDLFLIIVVGLFCFSCLFTLMYQLNVSTIQRLNNQLYDEHALFFKTSQDQLDFEILYPSLPADSVMFAKFFGQGEDIRGILFKGNFAKPQMISGRFFEEMDFQTNTRVAVIGKDVSLPLTMNEKKMIAFNGIDYEVIGIIGYNMPTRIDRTILLNMNEDNIHLGTEYVISGSTIQQGLNFIGNEELFGQVTLFEKENVNILHILDQGKQPVIVSTILLSILFVNSLSVLLLWMDKKNNEIKIKRDNGYSISQILWDVWKAFAPLLSISMILALGFCWLLEEYLRTMTISLLHTLASTIILFVAFSLVVISISYKKLVQR
ncbi:ABC transporter permease [Paenibacillus polysaccharolyticus]|uniref:ABC transporter permease n=1 Tax=Paenibacillus polysaccharolyticus TaxID=582692 RepID=UPI00203DBA39|nr:ABC transporter permease [Paenibacillus polysaccharolyticus]MCM3135269.1 ABC transporter permease [Paenibacillus polysaccharolyticus]